MPDRKSKISEHASDQHARFLETARALGCDEDEAAFDEKLSVIAKPTGNVALRKTQSQQAKKPVV